MTATQATMADDSLFGARRPRYVTLAEELTRAIRDGTYPVGSLMPAEPELCARHAVSRHTLREAVRMMRDLGLVRTRQGHGTLVESTQVPSRYVLSMDTVPDLWQYAESSALKVVSKRAVAAGEALTRIPGVDAKDKWYVVEAIRHTDDGTPLAWKHVYIRAAYKSVSDRIGKQRVPIYSLIEERFGIRASRVHHQLGAAAVPDKAATALSMKRGSTGFHIIRHYFDSAGEVFEVTLTIYQPDRLEYSFDLVLSNVAAGPPSRA